MRGGGQKFLPPVPPSFLPAAEQKFISKKVRATFIISHYKSFKFRERVSERPR